MLILSRKEDESIFIELSDKVDPNMTVNELFANGSIEIMVVENNGKGQVRIGINAPKALNIARSELLVK